MTRGEELVALEAEDQRKREAERYERDIKRIDTSTPVATESGWATERAGILDKDRQERTGRWSAMRRRQRLPAATGVRSDDGVHVEQRQRVPPSTRASGRL